MAENLLAVEEAVLQEPNLGTVPMPPSGYLHSEVTVGIDLEDSIDRMDDFKE